MAFPLSNYSCSLSQSKLGQLAGVSRTTIGNTLKKLEVFQYLSIFPQVDEFGGRLPAILRLGPLTVDPTFIRQMGRRT